MENQLEKRRNISLTKDEVNILKWLLFKALVPIIIIIVLSSIILFFGLEFLMKKVSFGNYGVAPGVTLQYVSQFITTYMIIAVANILLMVSLSLIVVYLALHNIILPVMRITREMKNATENKTKIFITVRKSDKLLVPIVDMINKLL